MVLFRIADVRDDSTHAMLAHRRRTFGSNQRIRPPPHHLRWTAGITDAGTKSWNFDHVWKSP